MYWARVKAWWGCSGRLICCVTHHHVIIIMTATLAFPKTSRTHGVRVDGHHVCTGPVANHFLVKDWIVSVSQCINFCDISKHWRHIYTYQMIVSLSTAEMDRSWWRKTCWIYGEPEKFQVCIYSFLWSGRIRHILRKDKCMWMMLFFILLSRVYRFIASSMRLEMATFTVTLRWPSRTSVPVQSKWLVVRPYCVNLKLDIFDKSAYQV